MSMYNPETGDYNPLALAVDTQAATSDQSSIFSNLGDVATKAVPLAGISMINGYANTALELGRLVGVTDHENLTPASWGVNQDMQDYYSQHQQGIDAAGLIAGSLVPGTLALKAFKAAQIGEMGDLAQMATNVFAGRQKALVDGAAKSLSDGTNLFNSMNTSRLAAVAYGVGDQALQGMVYEAATIATQKANPLLDDNGVRDTVGDLLTAGFTQGALGGLFGAFSTLGKFKGSSLSVEGQVADFAKTSRLGKFNTTFDGGDKAATILSSLDDVVNAKNTLTTPATTLQKMTGERNYDATLKAAKMAIGDIVPDQRIASDFIDAVASRMDGTQDSREKAAGLLYRLKGITPLGEDLPSSDPAGNLVYIGRKFDKPVGLQDIFSNAPNADSKAGIQLAYRIDPTKEIRMATADEVLLNGGVPIPKYANSKEAFAAGYDLFRNSKNEMIVNPDSEALTRVARPGESRILTQKEEAVYRISGQLPPGSRPLLTQGNVKFGEALPTSPNAATEWTNKPLILNLRTGAERESAIPVVGDYGKVTSTNNFVSAGDQTWKHDISAPIVQAESTAQEANSRFVWAANRGVKTGDVIHPTDLPMLEQMYREGIAAPEGWKPWIDKLTSKGKVSFADDGEHYFDASSPDRFLADIKRLKDEQISELLQNPSTTMSHEEVAIRTNTPEAYIENGQEGTSAKQLIIDPKAWERTNNVKFWYDTGNVYSQDGNIRSGLIDQQHRIGIIRDAAETQAASHFGAGWQQMQITKGSDQANLLGAGNRFLTFARASYGSLAQQAERVQVSFAKFQEQKMSSIAKVLYPQAQTLRNDLQSAADIGAFVSARQATGQKFIEMPEQLAAQHFPDMFINDPATVGPKQNGMIAILKDAIYKGPDGQPVWDRNFLPSGFIDGAASAAGTQGKYNFYKLSQSAADWERANQQVNDARIVTRNQWYAANGINRTLDLGILHAPAIDTSKYKYFALVKDRAGTALSDGGTAVVVAKDADTLNQRIAGLRGDYDVFTKDELASHFQATGNDYSADRNFSQSRVNSELARRGILSDIVPDTNPNVVINNYLDFHTRSELGLSRDTIETLNGQLFSELRAMGNLATTGSTSITGSGILQQAVGKAPYVNNPYDSYLKTALNLKDTDRYQMWHNAQERLSAFGDQAFAAVKNAFGLASKNQISWEDAAATAKKFGLGSPFGDMVDGFDKYAQQISNRLPDRDVLRKVISVGNSALGASVINLDTFQQMLHVLSTPIMLASEGLSATRQLKELITTELPDGSGRSIPAVSKVIFGAVKNYFDPAYQAKWMPVYKSLYAIREPGSEYLQDLQGLALPYGSQGLQKVADYLHSAVQFGTKYSGAAFTEHFTSWLSADVGKQLFEAAGQTGQELTDNITSFANRIKGTIISNQRPVAFQGPLGQAIGLFQTYQFNMFQNIARYVENGEGKTLATLFGMQQTLFGMHGLPGFQAINNHIVGIHDPQGRTTPDLYSGTTDFFGKKLGDYLLYGVASNWMNANLYSRSDINPRQISVLPVNPLNYPAISASIRVMGNIADTVKKIADGGDVKTSLLLGLEHNGLNRPLAGLAQLMNGFATSSGGNLISSATMPQTMGLSELYNAGIFSRLLGARPLDEAITLDAMYRSESAKAKTANQLASLGEAIKTKMYGGQTPSQEELESFMNEYTKAGGDIKLFGKHLTDWANKSNASVANSVFRQLSSPRAGRLMQAMGGQPLPDFRNTPSTSPAETNMEGDPRSDIP